MMQHLRESGNIEQDADMIITLYRPAQYKINMPDLSPEQNEIYTEMSIIKNRNGKKGCAVLDPHPKVPTK